MTLLINGKIIFSSPDKEGYRYIFCPLLLEADRKPTANRGRFRGSCLTNNSASESQFSIITANNTIRVGHCSEIKVHPDLQNTIGADVETVPIDSICLLEKTQIKAVV